MARGSYDGMGLGQLGSLSRAGRRFMVDAPSCSAPNRPTEAATTSLAIDQIISQGLLANDFKPLPLATPRDLVVRVHLDLTGLPPTALEADAFVADPSPKAYEALVDRLLKSRPHAEHWARHWLDVARYADSKGYAFWKSERSLLRGPIAIG